MARLVFWMPQERDPSGRFVKTPSDGAESGPEPEVDARKRMLIDT